MLEAISDQKSQIGILVRWPLLDSLDSLGLGIFDMFSEVPRCSQDFRLKNAPPRSHQNGGELGQNHVGCCFGHLRTHLSYPFFMHPLEFKEQVESPRLFVEICSVTLCLALGIVEGTQRRLLEGWFHLPHTHLRIRHFLEPGHVFMATDLAVEAAGNFLLQMSQPYET